jgi:tetratricopeptide (TPR) repeat protein
MLENSGRNACFDAGSLDAARAAYGRALAASRTPEQRIIALQKIGRTLERQGRYLEARSLCREHFGTALEVARGKRDDWLLGNLYNGLGLLEKRAEAFKESLARLRAALDYWRRADYPCGVGAACANIGTGYVAWGNQLCDARLPTEARNRYRRAVEWLVRCLEFSASARLGEDTSEAQAVLAEVYLGLDEPGQAWSMACAARDVAEKAGNQLDLASALSVLGAVYRFKGQLREAETCWEGAAVLFERLGHAAHAAKIRKGLEGKALLFPSEIH